MSKESQKSRKTYYDFIEQAAKPILEREPLVDARGGTLKAIRRHHLDEVSQKKILDQMEAEGKFVSPYKQFGGYWGAIQSLAVLGSDKFHPVSEVIKSYQAVMSDEASKDVIGRTAWERFKDKNPRSKKNGMDWLNRILQNMNVLQRLGGDDPYGLKLAQVGACVDLMADEHGTPLIRLRVNIPAGEPVVPINKLKQRNCPKSVESIPSKVIFANSAIKKAVRKPGRKSISVKTDE